MIWQLDWYFEIARFISNNSIFMVFDSLIDLLINEHSTAVASHAIVNNFSKFFVKLTLLCNIICHITWFDHVRLLLDVVDLSTSWLSVVRAVLYWRDSPGEIHYISSITFNISILHGKKEEGGHWEGRSLIKTVNLDLKPFSAVCLLTSVIFLAKCNFIHSRSRSGFLVT